MAQKPNVFDGEGKMLSGCIIRHLILPQATYDSIEIIKFIAGLKKDVFLSLMSQYTPFGDIQKFKELQRKITKREYQRVLSVVQEYDNIKVFLQDEDSADEKYIPQWDY